ncbi:MAG: DUF4301 family protein [Candidatus Mycalebacterium zealandia]|nr:MAG: DUF4301 family protein [Candidatus Mycalebacterium zealandia]
MKKLSVRSQIEILGSPPSFVRLVKPCAVGDGIVSLSGENKKLHRQTYDKKRLDYRVCVFVPASGAASRMFADLTARDSGALEEFTRNIKRFAFYEDLQIACARLRRSDVSSLAPDEIAELVLSAQGLGYEGFPKGLVKFHRYDGVSTTAFEDYSQLARAYADEIHFTVPTGFSDEEKNRLTQSGDGFTVSFSTQDPRTDTVVLDSDGNLLTDENGETVLRPAGHGALLENFGAVEADVVFISNIDNIAHASRMKNPESDRKALAGVLIEEMEKTPQDKPFRVCGVVKNTGEPGGAPFWVRDSSGCVSKRIVESVEVNHSDSAQEKVWCSATHFNPVDMVCSVRGADGRKFNLQNYTDDSFMVADKTFQGRPIKALEMPGLWNGAMAGWETVFVEIPVESFNPVKNIFDLLSDCHQDLQSERN